MTDYFAEFDSQEGKPEKEINKMDEIKIKEATLYFVDGSCVKYENARFMQSGVDMFFKFDNGRISVVNHDNLIRMTMIIEE